MPRRDVAIRRYSDDKERWAMLGSTPGLIRRSCSVYVDRGVLLLEWVLRRNVDFFDSSDEARSAGYRACQRCRPESASSKPLWWIEIGRSLAS